jgi:hypothetical protein
VTTPASHNIGHVKHDPETHQIAIRTIHDHPSMEWSVSTAAAGARHANTSEVQDWDDLHIPGPPT